MRQFAVEFVLAGLVDTNATALDLIGNSRFLDERLDEVVDGAVLGYKNIIRLLQDYISYTTIMLVSNLLLLTSLVMPSLSQLILTLFFVSSSARLMSRTSKYNASDR